MMERQYKDSGIEWIGRIPEGWETQRGKTLGDISHGVSFTPSDLRDKDEGVLILRASNVQNSQLDYQDNVYIPKSKIPIEKLLKKDDIVICGTNGSLALVGKSALVKEDMEASYGSFMLRMRTKKEPRFIHYQLTQIVDMYRGLFATTTINQLTISQLQNIIFVIPPLPEQQRIASYLDKKCGEIDELIALQEKMIAQLTEYKQAVITEAVTKGLDPNAKLVPSGIEWIGDVPEGWKSVRLKSLFKRRNEKNDPVTTKERLSLSIDKGVTLYSEKTTNLDRFKEDFSQYQLAYPDDIVLNSMNMIVGAVGLSKYKGCVSPVYYVIYSNKRINIKYYSLLLNTQPIRDVYHSLGKGIYAIERGDGRVNTCRLKVSYDDFETIHIPLPCKEEQDAIATYLDTKCSEIDSLIALKRQKIESLNAYKKSVIYEAVTGKTIIE